MYSLYIVYYIYINYIYKKFVYYTYIVYYIYIRIRRLVYIYIVDIYIVYKCAHTDPHYQILSKRWIHKQCVWMLDSTNPSSPISPSLVPTRFTHSLSRPPDLSHTNTDILRFHQEENCEPKLPTSRQASIEVLRIYIHIHIHTCMYIYLFIYV